MASSLSQELRDKLFEIQHDPETMDKICDFVAGGDSLIPLCKLWGVPFSNMMRWIHADPTRESRYKAALIDRNEHTQESIINELKSIAHADIRKAFTESGALKPIHEIPDDIAKALNSVEIDELFDGFGEAREHVGQTKKIKFHDKIKALELVGKDLSMFVTNKHVHEGTVTFESLVASSMPDNLKPKKME